ncbi:1135_t:CDS:2 [Paraglomus brasilianum]|uniref:DNA topoisomerase (ATP-hydrolyzing) n=1 Tax=Paraglomus brasilianum TaxID=144538 RepID=A0A9N9DEV7_9GLOM|nr:1135_t:CDS:2 [Paraglomus brasilianum]
MIAKLLHDLANGYPLVIECVSKAVRKDKTHTRYDDQSRTLKRTNTSTVKRLRFPSLKNPKSFAVFVRILEICHELLIQNITATKRDIYYKDVQLFVNQNTVDQAIDELACLFRVPRSCLNVIASAKGLVAGALTIIRSDGVTIDCLIPRAIPHADSIRKIESTADIVIVVEKEVATFHHLLSINFLNKINSCILITGKGYPDIATRQLVKLLDNHFKRRGNASKSPNSTCVFGFFDNDPYGIDILCVYKYGSTSMSFDSQNLATPDMQWIGLHCRDWRTFVALDKLLPMTFADRKKALGLLSREYLPNSWMTEICRMLFVGKKAELQCLGDKDAGDVTDYLATKLKNPKAWL